MSSYQKIFRCFLVSAIPAGLAALLVAWFFSVQDYQAAYHARTEFGFIEQTSSYLWLLPIGSCLGLGLTRRNSNCLLIAWFCLILLCRELDLHKLYTPESVSSTRYWRSGAVSPMQKVMVGALLLATIFGVALFLRHGRQPFLRALRSDASWTGAVLALFVIALVPVVLDNVLDMDALDDPTILFASLLEESFEMMIPVILAAAIVLWAVAQHQAREQSALQEEA